MTEMMSGVTDTIHVLHVDDEPDFADMAARFLEREDDRLDIRTTNSPANGLERLAENEIGCIVSDYDMPHTNGIEFLESVREEYPELPFILYTGKGSEEIASEAVTAGVTDYLQKQSGTGQYELLANRIINVVSQYRATKAAERAQRRLRELAEKTNDILWMFSGDWSELLFINSAYEEIWGQETEVLRNRPGAFLEAVHPDDRERAEQAMHRVSEGESRELELRVNSGEEYQRHVWIQGEPIFNESGDVARIVGFGRDITDRKEREQRYTAIFDQTYQFTGLLEPDGTIIEANETALEFGGVERDDVIGTKMWEATWFEHSKETRDRARTAVRRAAEGTFVRDELTLEGDDRDAIIDFSVRPVTNDEGEVSLLIPEGRDITERKEHERKRQQIINRMNDAVIEVSSDWGITLVNEPVEQFTGQDESALLGRDFWDVFSTARGTDFEAEYRKVMRSRESGSIVGYYEGVDEWFDIDVYPNDDGGLAFYFLSITDHKKRENELERTRDFFTEAERLGNLGAWEFRVSGDLVWTDGTRRIHEVGDEFEPTINEALQFFHPDDRGTMEQAVERALEHGESYERDVRLITAQDNQRWIRTRGSVLPDTEQPTVRGYVQDITDQKERERELRQTNAQLENAIEAGAVGTWEWHVPDDRLVVGNEFARRFGVDPDLAQEGVELDRFISSIHTDDREWVEREIEEVVDACGEYEAEYRVRDVNDELNWVLARGNVECDEEGSAVRFPGVLVDITERKQIEEELQRQNERLNEFASVVSHDLRNPLNVVEGRLELAQEECDSEHLKAIERAQERMDTLITGLLSLAREGETTSDMTTVDLGDRVDSCWKNVDTAEATLINDVTRIIRADESRISQLFENIIRNAIEHGGEDVTVIVGELADGYYIEDDGPGIPDEASEKVFEAGYSTTEHGTGFGLSIVKQIVDAHDWEIHVTEGAHDGTRFEITGVEFTNT